METHGIIRTLYLYIAAFVGLALLTAGGVRLVDLGLKATVFTQAEAEARIRPAIPPPERAPYPDTLDLSPAEQAEWDRWREDQRRVREEMQTVDHVAAQRARTASSGLALLIIGLPLYMYHWRLIRREIALRRRSA